MDKFCGSGKGGNTPQIELKSQKSNISSNTGSISQIKDSRREEDEDTQESEFDPHILENHLKIDLQNLSECFKSLFNQKRAREQISNSLFNQKEEVTSQPLQSYSKKNARIRSLNVYNSKIFNPTLESKRGSKVIETQRERALDDIIENIPSLQRENTFESFQSIERADSVNEENTDSKLGTQVYPTKDLQIRTATRDKVLFIIPESNSKRQSKNVHSASSKQQEDNFFATSIRKRLESNLKTENSSMYYNNTSSGNSRQNRETAPNFYKPSSKRKNLQLNADQLVPNISAYNSSTYKNSTHHGGFSYYNLNSNKNSKHQSQFYAPLSTNYSVKTTDFSGGDIISRKNDHIKLPPIGSDSQYGRNKPSTKSTKLQKDRLPDFIKNHI